MIFVVYIILCLPAVLFPHNEYSAWWGVPHRGMGFLSLLVLVFLGMYIRYYPEKESLKKTFIFIGVVSGIYSIAQFLGFNFIGNNTQWLKTTAFTGNSNMAGNLFALLLPFFLQKKSKWAVFCITGLILSGSRSALIAGSVVLIFWYIPLSIRKYVPLIFIAIFVLGRFFLPYSLENRLSHIFHWERTYRGRIFVESIPLVNFRGFGSGGYREEFGKIKSRKLEEDSPRVLFDHPHNVYLNHLLEYGVLSSLCWLFILLKALRAKDRAFRYAVLSYMVWGFGSFDTPETHILLLPILGVAHAEQS